MADAQGLQDFLTGDVLGKVGPSGQSIFVARLKHVDSRLLKVGDLTYAVGTLNLEVLENLQGQQPAAHASIELHFHQISAGPTLKSDPDYWNRLILQPDHLFLFAARPSNDGKVWHASAGTELSSASASPVDVVRFAEQVIGEPNPVKKRAELTSALFSNDSNLFIFAATALAQRRILGSTESASTLATALNSKSLPSANALELPNQMVAWFSPETQSDLQGSRDLIQALALKLTIEPSKARKVDLAFKLLFAFNSVPAGSTVPSPRTMVLQSAQEPSPAAVQQTLESLSKDHALIPNAKDREQLLEFAHLWRTVSSKGH